MKHDPTSYFLAAAEFLKGAAVTRADDALIANYIAPVPTDVTPQEVAGVQEAPVLPIKVATVSDGMPKKAAGILFITDGGKVLVGQRAAYEGVDYPGVWGCFGGHHEEGETIELTALRECWEETGHVAEGELQLIAQTMVDNTEFTYFVNICKPFDVVINYEHLSYQWLSLGELPLGDLHPGMLEVLNSVELTDLRKLKMNELHIARAMANGSLPSPQRYASFSMYKMRITGTGKAVRKGDGKKIKDEIVFRRPEIYLNPEFLDRCQGLEVIFQHPAKRVLDSEEYRERMIGTIVCPFIQGQEVWGIARIRDADAMTLLDNEKMSTSPSVVFQDRTVNSSIKLNDGSTLLVEGDPSLLDHLAVCEAGVWDKEGDPSGVISETTGSSENE